MSNTKCSRKRGFTLVELSIVIIIIGLLIAGIAAGDSLIRQAALSSVITDLTNFRTDIIIFKDKYSGLPGDLPNAYAWFGASCGTNDTGQTTSCNGNGDGSIDTVAWWIAGSPYEDLRAWQHLALAGLVPGSFPGVTVDSNRELVGVNVPASKLSGVGYSFGLDDPQSFYGVSVAGKNLITVGSLSGGAQRYLGGMVNPTDGLALDAKMDDGNNLTGEIMIVGAHDDWGNANQCTVGVWASGTGSGQLNFANDNANCRIVYIPSDLQVN